MSRQVFDLTFGEWLEDELTARRWSHERLGRMIDFSTGSVDSWIAGRRNPSARACDAIAAALGVSQNEVRRRAGKPLVEEIDQPHVSDNNELVQLWAARIGAMDEDDRRIVEVVIEEIEARKRRNAERDEE